MAQTLLSKKLIKKLHIALLVLFALLGLQANAQSVLLPGDVVIVSANADTPSIDFIPLIDIERGTSIYFSDGKWDRSENFLEGNELHLTFNESILAGTNLHINRETDTRFSINGNLDFEGDAHRLFVYQKEEEIHRFIFAMGWGKGTIWTTPERQGEGSDIPISLDENTNSLLTLGEESNQQYFIRNGASGTKNMLLSLVGNLDNWRGDDENPFNTFGTSFNLMSPPIIQFDNSVSKVSEGDSTAVLNVAIYEHDGSRISVDVEFDSLRSIARKADLNGFSSKTINFTGLIGDYNYAVDIPISDNDVYEGGKTGIFTLNNLSSGNYGDFLTHNLIIEDNEQPEIIISRVANSSERSGFIEIQNLEEGTVSMKGWILSGKELKYEFSDEAVLLPEQTLRWIDAPGSEPNKDDDAVFTSGLKNRMLQADGGVLTLQDLTGRVVHQVSYSKLRNTEGRESRRMDLAVREVDQNSQTNDALSNQVDQSITALKTQNSGWKVLSGIDGLSEEFSDKSFYSWNEKLQGFQLASEAENKDQTVFGFFEKDEMEPLTTHVSEKMSKAAAEEKLSFTVSATDHNENEILDGIEGLNLVFNDLDRSISVLSFMESLESEYSELPVSQAVYELRQKASGALEFNKLDVNDSIAPKTPFFIMLESVVPATTLSLNKDDLKEESNSRDINEEKEQGRLQLTLKSESEEEAAEIRFSDELSTERTKDLNSYPELYLPDQPYLNFSFKEGDEFYNTLTLFSEMERQVELPVHFSSSEDGNMTFSVTEWEEIPSDWAITLVDQKTDKEYNLRRDFSVTIEHDFAEGISTDDPEKDRFSNPQYREEDRFLVKAGPKKAIAENEEEVNDKPRQVELDQNYPNPFNPVTTISFYLPQSEEVRLSVFNIVGQPVAVIVDGTLSAGEQQFEWDATDKPSGMYIYQLEVGNSVMTRKMTLVK